MLKYMRVHGFRTLVNTEATFAPFTIMVGKNGVGKTTVLDVVQIIGKFARGGASRAFGPPPWSLGWQRTKGIGRITTTDFELQVGTGKGSDYRYVLKLNEQSNEVKVEEERLNRLKDNTSIAAFEWGRPPASGTILRPDVKKAANPEIEAVSTIFSSFQSYELNPSAIERGNDPKMTYVGRDGFGVAGCLAHLKDEDDARFQKLEEQLKIFRPETQAIEVWAPAGEVFWGLRDKGQQYPFNAVHLSWGDRQLVGLLCVLFTATAGSTIAIEEMDRGFHPSRYKQVIELLTRAVYEGLMKNEKIQVIVTTHSPSLVNKLADHLNDIRIVQRSPTGGTVIRALKDVLVEKLGTTELEQPLGEVWELGLFEEAIGQAIE